MKDKIIEILVKYSDSTLFTKNDKIAEEILHLFKKKSKKQQNKEIREKYAFQKELEENPDFCHCRELLNKEPDFIPETDEIIGKSDEIIFYPYHTERHPLILDYYKCKRCGKKAYEQIVYA